jgi:23S rRNA (guanine2445-N2)-methyltransferase / 23S rRNA (guanine2069-N7)-methyltransferase
MKTSKQKLPKHFGGPERSRPTRPSAEGDLEFFARCAAGFEGVLARELRGLDLRPVRALIRELAPGGHFLSLGSYAGVPAVCAAAGGAASTTTVDESSSYLDWAGRNLAANGYTGKQHRLVRSLPAGRTFDLLYVDSALLALWPLDRLAELLAPKGSIVLVSHQRTYRIDADELAHLGLAFEDASARTIPHDFARTPKIHRCLLLRHM